MNEKLPEFPCSFPIKVMGLDEPGFLDLAIDLVSQHAGNVSGEAVRVSHSKNGKYLSVTITIEAQSQHQLDDIYRELTANERVKVVL